MFVVGKNYDLVGWQLNELYCLAAGLEVDRVDVDVVDGVAADQKRIAEGHGGSGENADGNVLDYGRFQTMKGEIQSRVLFVGVGGIASVDGHSGVSALDQKPEILSGSNHGLILKGLVVHEKLPMAILHHNL
jgi:hypothetical protein